MTTKLKITEIERITLDVPFTPRVHPWNELLVGQWRVVEIMRVVTDAGFVGYGETLPHYTWGRVSDEAVARVKGGNPADFMHDDSLGAGLQMALWDVVGKALGVPMHRLLGQPKVRDWCTIGWWNTKAPPEVLAAEAQDALAQGYMAHKFKARPWFDVYEQVAQISRVTPVNYRLDMDWNEMLRDVGNAAPVLTELDKNPRIAIYEEPIPRGDVEGYRRLRQHTTRPTAQHYSPEIMRNAAQREVTDGFVVGGGVSATMRAGLAAGEFNKPFWLQLVGVGLVTAFAAHLGAVLPWATWPAISCLNNYSDDCLAQPLEIKGGYVRVPDAPGLGVEIDEDAIRKYRVSKDNWWIDYPRKILSVVWEGGRVMHYTTMPQCWTDFRNGNQPLQEPGVRLHVWHDDGTPEFDELHRRAELAPVRDSRN
ncbi:MAG: mandelate racemase/muconate lactonizing enzyme family protein [Chloroflexi bacterium]|jgi:L-alanine-DL-glutamate epimerase-like enolase superfamily enzyme|nr:mandelate racemase/muconate lactonizing enzyme family protein [Chloroflexota bacterium]